MEPIVRDIVRHRVREHPVSTLLAFVSQGLERFDGVGVEMDHPSGAILGFIDKTAMNSRATQKVVTVKPGFLSLDENGPLGLRGLAAGTRESGLAWGGIVGPFPR